MFPFRLARPASFAKDEKGAVAVIFAFTLIPMVICAAAAVDYAKTIRDREHLRDSLDAAGLALAHEAKNLNDAQLQLRAQALFEASYSARTGAHAPTVSIQRTQTHLSLSATNYTDTHFARVIGRDQIEYGSRTTVAYGTPNIEVALVLDNTGSMGEVGKMEALKAAANDFIDKLAAKATSPGQIKVSIVPFTTQVRIDPRGAGLLASYETVVDPSSSRMSWVNMGATSPVVWTASACFNDRSAPTYDADPRPGERYPADKCWYSTQSTMIGLSDVSIPARKAELKTTINNMQSNGATNLTIGLAWGQWTLTPGNPLGAAANFGGPSVKKFIVLLTDGDNTANAANMSPGQIDARTRAACAAAKDPAKQTTVFTVRVIAGNINLLRDCASSPSKYFEASDAAGIQPAFKAILDSILAVRLTS
jgi:Flp pilus assembly protein TadG